MSAIAVQLEMISKIEVGDCRCRLPCGHPTTVWLKDGRVSHELCGLNGVAICALLKAVPKGLFENIEYIESHFSRYADPKTYQHPISEIQKGFMEWLNILNEPDFAAKEIQGLFDR